MSSLAITASHLSGGRVRRESKSRTFVGRAETVIVCFVSVIFRYQIATTNDLMDFGPKG